MIKRGTLFGTIMALVSASSLRMELPADSSQTIESDYDHLALSLGIGWRF